MEIDIKDRIAVGDDKYIIEDLGDGRQKITPSPDRVDEVGTPINKELLQPIVDAVPVLFEIQKNESGEYSFLNDKTAEELFNLLEDKRNVVVKKVYPLGYATMNNVSKLSTPFGTAYLFEFRSGNNVISNTFTKSGFSGDSEKTFLTTEMFPEDIDFIEEQGTSGNWTYRKWASGIAECWGKVDAFSGTQTAYGNIYASPEMTVLRDSPFPFEFAETPNVTLGLETAGFSGIILSGEIHSREHIGTFFIGSFVSIGTDKPITVHAQVKGRWK